MSFDALLADLDALDTLQKARPPQQHQEPDADDAGGQPDGDADDAAIRAAAGGDADDDGSSDGDDLPELDDQKAKAKKKKPQMDEDDDDEDEYLGKSFAMTDANGQTVHAYDGTALIKSLHQRIVAHETDIRAVLEKTTVMLKALHADLHALQAQGRGRKTVLNVHDKPVGHFASPVQEPKTLLSKALTAQRNGRITGQDVARIESLLNRGMTVPPDLADAIN